MIISAKKILELNKKYRLIENLAERELNPEGLGIDVRVGEVYRLEGITAVEAELLARQLLAEEVDQEWSLDSPLVADADRIVEVAYLPGVMNPEAASILKAAQDLGVQPVAADASREYAFYGPIDDAALEAVLVRLLVNPTVERVLLEVTFSFS